MGSPLYEINVRRLSGATVKLDAYAGSVLLIVNVASQRILTRQYSDLERLHRTYSERGFAVLGFISNDFDNEECGDDADHEVCCTSNYDVDFPMFEKISAKGANQHPLYRHLIAMQPVTVARPNGHLLAHLLRNGYLSAPPARGEVLWNFEKFLISRRGDAVARFASDVSVDQLEFLKAIEQQLAVSAKWRPRNSTGAYKSGGHLAHIAS